MKLYGLLGWPLGYSWSPLYFAEKFKREKIEAEYHEFPLAQISDFTLFIARTPDLCGLNVTIPYKSAILPFLDELSPEASIIGAVNTIQFAGKKCIGHNTDAFGFEQQLAEVDVKKISGALILGTGGAAKAIAYVLSKHGISFHFISRNPANGIAYSALNQDIVSKNNLIINCTPAGTFPAIENCPPFAAELFSPETVLIDLIYNPPRTQLMTLAQARGAQTFNGLKMLHFQAERAWQIWQA